MKKLFPYSLIFLSILSLFSCTITKRKYTGGFYVNWHKKAPDAITPHPTLSYEERVKSGPPLTREVVVHEEIKGKLCPPVNKISTTFKVNSLRNATSRVQENESTKEGSTTSNAPDKRFLDRGLAGFEAALLDLIAFGLLVLFAHWGYAVFVLGCLLLILGLSIYSLIYCFMGLNTNDRHRGLGFVGLLITIGVIVGVFLVGL